LRNRKSQLQQLLERQRQLQQGVQAGRRGYGAPTRQQLEQQHARAVRLADVTQHDVNHLQQQLQELRKRQQQEAGPLLQQLDTLQAQMQRTPRGKRGGRRRGGRRRGGRRQGGGQGADGRDGSHQAAVSGLQLTTALTSGGSGASMHAHGLPVTHSSSDAHAEHETATHEPVTPARDARTAGLASVQAPAAAAHP